METKRATMLGLMLGLVLTLSAQMESRLSFRRYTTQDGLPQMQTERLWQDSNGYIYIGTLSGFVRFDGRTFTPFLKGRRENIVGFTETRRGVTAMGFRRQWTIKDTEVEKRPIDPDGHWQLNNLNALSLPDGYVILEDEQETHRRLCQVTEQGFKEKFTGGLLDEMTPDRKLYHDSLCTLIPTPKGLYRIKHGKQTASLLTHRGDILTLLHTDTALLAFTPNGIWRIRETRTGTVDMECVVGADWSASTFGLVVRKLRKGGLVVADEHTVYLYEDGRLRQVMTGINLIRDLFVDRWDRLWVATYQGVYCFFNRCFTNHRLTDENDIVRAIATDEADRLVMGTLNGKILVMGPTSSNITIVSDNPSQYYGSSATGFGRQVFMPDRGGVTRVENGQFSRLPLPQDRYRFVTRMGDRLLIVSQTLLLTYDLETQALDTLTLDIPHPWCAEVDADGRLWTGSTLGIYGLNTKREVSQLHYPQQLVVTTMETDHRGTVFFASADSLFLIRQGEIEALNPLLPVLAGHEIRSLHVSPRGYLVVAVIDGLFVCRIGNDYQPRDIHFFDYHNGFTMLEPLKATMAETADGTVWLAGVEEMTSFRPAALLAYNEEDTYISPPLRWWQHWWLGLCALLLCALAIWAATYWYEKLRNHKKMIRLQHEKLERERQLDTIRQKAIEAESTELAKDIVRMTERTDSPSRITLRTVSGTLVVEASDIAYFKGDGNYSQICTFDTRDTVLIGLGALEKMLDSATFVRADRSTLVNVHNISRLQPKQRRCIFRSASGQEVEATLLAPAFARLQRLL